MSLEEEAKSFSSSNLKVFLEALDEVEGNLKQYYEDNLWVSDERTEAILKVTESIMWAKLAAEKHGIR